MVATLSLTELSLSRYAGNGGGDDSMQAYFSDSLSVIGGPDGISRACAAAKLEGLFVIGWETIRPEVDYSSGRLGESCG